MLKSVAIFIDPPTTYVLYMVAFGMYRTWIVQLAEYNEFLVLSSMERINTVMLYLHRFSVESRKVHIGRPSLLH